MAERLRGIFSTTKVPSASVMSGAAGAMAVLPEEVKRSVVEGARTEPRTQQSWRWSATMEAVNSSWTSVPLHNLPNDEDSEAVSPQLLSRVVAHESFRVRRPLPLSLVAKYSQAVRSIAVEPSTGDASSPRARRGSLILSKAAKAIMLSNFKSKASPTSTVQGRRGSTGTAAGSSGGSSSKANPQQSVTDLFSDTHTIRDGLNTVLRLGVTKSHLQNFLIDPTIVGVWSTSAPKRSGRRLSRVKLLDSVDQLLALEGPQASTASLPVAADVALKRSLLQSEVTVKAQTTNLSAAFVMSTEDLAGDIDKMETLATPSTITSLLLVSNAKEGTSKTVSPVAELLMKLTSIQLLRKAAHFPTWPGMLYQYCQNLQQLQLRWATAVQVTQEATWTRAAPGSGRSSRRSIGGPGQFDLDGFLDTEATLVEEGENEEEDIDEEEEKKKAARKPPPGGRKASQSHLTLKHAVDSMVNLYTSKMNAMQVFEQQVREETEGITESLQTLHDNVAGNAG